MKSYFDKAGQKIKEKMSEYWRRALNRSTRTKMSEGAIENNRVITSAHKDEWRRNQK